MGHMKSLLQEVDELHAQYESDSLRIRKLEAEVAYLKERIQELEMDLCNAELWQQEL